MNEIKQKIPARLESAVKGGYVTGAKDIVDDALGKAQSVINEEVTEDVSDLKEAVGTGGSVDERINAEKTRATNAEQGLDTRLNVVEQLAEISVEGGEIGIATAEDLKNRTPEGDAKIPTVAAVMDSADDNVIENSSNIVSSGAVAKLIMPKTNNIGKFFLTDHTGAIFAMLDKEDVLKIFVKVEIENLKAKEVDVLGSNSLVKQIQEGSERKEVLIYTIGNDVVVGFDQNGERFGANVRSTVYENNKHRESEMLAACHFGKDTVSTIGYDTSTNPPTPITEVRKQVSQFMISTDTHENEGAFERFIDSGRNFESVNALISLGDNTPVDQDITHFDGFMKHYSDIIRKCHKPVYYAVGNHEVGHSKRLIEAGASDEQLYNWFVKPAVDNGWLIPGEYTTNKLYFYHVFFDNTILIMLYPFDDGNEIASLTETITAYNPDTEEEEIVEDKCYWKPIVYSSSYSNIEGGRSYVTGDKVNVKNYTKYSFECTEDVTPSELNWGRSLGRSLEYPRYKTVRSHKWYSEEQLEWFCNTLKYASQNNMKCIIAQHMPFTTKGHADMSSCFSDEDSLRFGNYDYRYDGDNTDIIAQIVDACKNKTEIVADITPRSTIVSGLIDNTSSMNAVHLSYDFSLLGENNGIKGVFYIGGHYHKEYLVVHDDYPYQKQLLSVCGKHSNEYGCVGKPYDEKNISFDRINVVTIRDNGVHLLGLGPEYSGRLINGKLLKRDNEFIEF